MNDKYKIIPKITLIVLLALGIVFALMFFFGGNSSESLEVAGESLSIPKFSELFLTWNYILIGLVVLTTLVVVVAEFCSNCMYNRRKAFMTLGAVVGLVVLCCVCWFLGSSEPLEIIGFEDLQGLNEQQIADYWALWGKLADAVIYACYILFGATVCAMLWGYIHTKRLK